MNIRLATVGTIAAASMMLVFSPSGQCQNSTGAETPYPSARWHSDHVVYVAGLSEIKPESEGSLVLTPETLAFSGKKGADTIPLDQITAVYIGDERVATGGAGAKVARRIPFFGFGAAMGAVTNKKVDVLTIEYHDKNGAYHGAVFEVPKKQAVLAQQQFVSFAAVSPVSPAKPCSGVAGPETILVNPIVSTVAELPEEYRVLLYEQLVEQLKTFAAAGTVYRVGDTETPCAAQTLQLSVTAFKKGNEAVRSSTGPMAMFVGGTSVTFHVTLVNATGAMLFEKSLKNTKHGDGDSLTVTLDLAKSVSKHLRKARQSAATKTS